MIKKLNEIYHPEFKKREFVEHHDVIQHNHVHLTAHHDNSDLAPHEHDAIRDYTEDSRGLNHYLHSDKDIMGPNLQHDFHAETLGNVIKSAPALKEPLSTYSGISHHLGTQMKVGSVLHTPAFTSTSIQPTMATDFGTRKTKSVSPTGQSSIKQHHILNFKLPEGYKKGRYIDDVSVQKGEKEFLLHHDQHFKVTGHHVHRVSETKIGGEKDHVYHHTWTVEPHNPDPAADI